jgi:ABC-2 type transport system ATP-binding protein
VASHLWILREGEFIWRGEMDQMKESVVRLHLLSDQEITALPALPGQLSCSLQGRTATAVLRDWKPDILASLEQLTGSRIEVEPLGLEDIFLAVHA